MQKITVGIDGMMCGMCESHINDVIRKNFNVKKVTSSHTKNETVIISKEDIDEEKLKSVVGETGYTVTSVAKEPYEKKGFFSKNKK